MSDLARPTSASVAAASSFHSPSHHQVDPFLFTSSTSNPVRPFTAPLPIITDNTTGANSHPRVFYIFSDDEATILPSALSTIHNQDPSVHRFDRALLVDLAPSDSPTGWIVASASSMTPDWAVTNAALLPMGGTTATTTIGMGTSPSSITGASPAAAASATHEEDDSEEYTVLQITGSEVSSAPSARALRVPFKANSERDAMDIQTKDYSGLIAEFNEQMSGLQMLADAGKWSLEQYRFSGPREDVGREEGDEEEDIDT